MLLATKKYFIINTNKHFSSTPGFPSELVYYGSAMWETLYGIIIAFPLVCWIFVPVYYRLHTNSVYEYLQVSQVLS